MTTTFATPPEPAAASDPTDVMGRRIAAWILDALLVLVIAGVGLGLTGEYKQIDEGFDGNETEFCQKLLDDSPDFEGNCISPPFGDRVYLIEYSDTSIYSGAIAAWVIVNMVILQGLAGFTIGKGIFGLRVVNRHGNIASIGKSIVRTLAWLIDGLPGPPIVGGVVAVTSTGHRRVGDLVARTYVVRTASMGRPVDVPAAAVVPPGAQAWGAAPPVQPAEWNQPQQEQPTYEPQWDEARGTYIQWDPARATWVQWDSAENTWIPIS